VCCRTIDGLVIYRFAATLYYANAHQLVEQSAAFLAAPPPPRWFCLDCVAIGDIDFTAAAAAPRTRPAGRRRLPTAAHHTSEPVRAELDRYGITALLGAQGYYPVPRDVLDPYRHQPDPAAPSPQPVTGQPPASTSLPGRVTP